MSLLLSLFILSQHYLLEPSIQKALVEKNPAVLVSTFRPRVELDLEAPLSLTGFLPRAIAATDLCRAIARRDVHRIEWSSLQVEDNLAVQALDVVWKDRLTGELQAYKFIFFMVKDPEWGIYSLRGRRF